MEVPAGLGAFILCAPPGMARPPVATIAPHKGGGNRGMAKQTPELESALDALESGLRMLGRERVVVLSQHHGFELIEQMQGHLARVRESLSAGASPAKANAKAPAKDAKKAD